MSIRATGAKIHMPSPIVAAVRSPLLRFGVLNSTIPANQTRGDPRLASARRFAGLLVIA